jgi:hypothetical protein
MKIVFTKNQTKKWKSRSENRPKIKEKFGLCEKIENGGMKPMKIPFFHDNFVLVYRKNIEKSNKK